MDEGTSALDQKNAHMIENMIMDDPNLTLILITHHLEEANRSKFKKNLSFTIIMTICFLEIDEFDEKEVLMNVYKSESSCLQRWPW